MQLADLIITHGYCYTENNLVIGFSFELCVTKTTRVADNATHLPVEYKRMWSSFSLGWSAPDTIIALMVQNHNENPFVGRYRESSGDTSINHTKYKFHNNVIKCDIML